jgi:uncharacterized membrane protein
MTERRSIGSRLLGFGLYLLAIAILAGIVHIVSVLALPRLAPRDAFARVSALASVGKLTVLDPVAPKSSVFAFEDPATALGVCRYDLSGGPLEIVATLPPEQMMLFSFHGRYGDVFYSMTDRAASKGRLDVLVLTPDQLDAYEAHDTGDEMPKELRIVSPTPDGFVLLRAFAAQPGDLDAARAVLGAISCNVAALPGS